MDNLPKHSSFKTLEVIWNRNTSTHKPKLLPELKGINIEDSVEKVKKTIKHPVVKINENKTEHVHKRVKRSLFREDKKGKAYQHSDPEELNKKLYENFDYANSLRKRNYSIYKASQLNCPTKSLQIVSNRKNIIRNQDASLHTSKQRLFPKKSTKTEISSSHMVNDQLVIKPSYTKDQLNSRTNVFGCSESPEIMSNRKRYVTNNNFDKTGVSKNDNINDKTCIDMPIVRSTDKLNTKYNNVNIHISSMESKFNPANSEDIIEPSEKIVSPVMKKKKKKSNRIHTKKTIIKNYTNGSKVPECKTFTDGKNEINLSTNEIQKSTNISTTSKNAFSGEFNFDSIDIINTENILKSPLTKFLKKSSIVSQEYQNRGLGELCINSDGNQNYCDTSLTHSSLSRKKFTKTTVKEHSKILEHHRKKLFNQNEDNIISFMHSSEISVIPSTPEHESINLDNSIVQYSPEIISSPYVPLIEVDQSPKTPREKNNQVLIQSVQTPPNVEGITLPGLFEPIASPTQSFVNNELPFKIDSIESPRAIHEDDIIFSPKINRRKSDNSPSSPNRFDSAKKRKKMNKDGLRGKFRDLINRKKSEACIREYEKSLSKNYKPKQGETALLKVIEAWKEFRMIVLLCYHMKSDKEVQRVLVTLNNCPLNAAKNSVIRIYSPWLTIKSDITEVLLFTGIIHAEVIEFSESIPRSLELVEESTNHNGLLTTVLENKVLWKCNCSKDAACQCLGELSAYNYLQYMIPH